MRSNFFEIGARVIISAAGGWKKDSFGIICGGPEPIETMMGAENYYWVKFDIPQECIDGDDEYSKAQILSCYLELKN